MGSLPMVGRTAQSVVKMSSSSSSSSSSSPRSTPLPVPLSCFRDRPISRSPIESPPLQKKPLRFVETGRLFSKAMESPLSCILGTRSPEVQGNRSILRNGNREVTCKNRKVNFRQKVLVSHFDRNEGGHVCFETKVLNVEPEVKNVLRPLNASTSPTNSTTFLSGQMSRQTTDVVKNRLEPSDGGGSNSHRRIVRGSSTQQQQQQQQQQKKSEFDSETTNVEFHFTVDENRTSVLRFSLPLGAGISAGDVIVKANKTGNRVRILGAENCNREINERFGLPVRVDPYRISARMDANGMLFVEAPTLAGEPKNGLLSGRKSR